MKSRSLIVYLLAVALLVFPAVGHAYSFEVAADETLEEVERIVEARTVRTLTAFDDPSINSLPKDFSIWNEYFTTQEEKPFVVFKKFLVLRVLRL